MEELAALELDYRHFQVSIGLASTQSVKRYVDELNVLLQRLQRVHHQDWSLGSKTI
jgi:hypothetical protein